MEVICFVVGTLFSGLVSAIVTIFYQRKFEVLREQKELFLTFLSQGNDITSCENIEALNRIPAVFSDEPEILHTFEAFCELYYRNEGVSDIEDIYFRLLELISETIGYPELKWYNLKRHSIPLLKVSKKSKKK